MKKSVIIGCIVIAAVIFCIYFFRNDIYKLFDGNEKFIGNYNGNIANAGMVTENDKYIFISAVSGKNIGIFRKSKENGKLLKISNDLALYLNIYDDNLYYVNLTENGKIYKIDDEGNDKEQVIDLENCEYFNISDDNVFFEYPEKDKIYSPYIADINFGSIKKLNDNDIEGLVFNNGYLYYSNWDDGGKIYRMKIDGSEKASLNTRYSSFINVDSEYIYYINTDDEYKIYKMKIDGSENSLICEDSANYLNYYDGYLYFSNETDENKIYKVKTDGTEKTKISDDRGNYISIVDNKLYFIRQNDQNLYNINFDGSDGKIVLE